jgi:hypothetical protein
MIRRDEVRLLSDCTQYERERELAGSKKLHLQMLGDCKTAELVYYIRQ